jgi:hypothetical protein
MPDTVRGVRDHNPFDLEDFGIKWQGLDTPPHDDAGFCRFVSDFYGIRAGFIDIHSKWSKHKLRTVTAIITVYAPPTKLVRLATGELVRRKENDTEGYIQAVAKDLGVQPDTLLDLSVPGNLLTFGRAVIRHEIGSCPFSDKDLEAAVSAALMHAQGGTVAKVPPPAPQPPKTQPLVTTGTAVVATTAGVMSVQNIGDLYNWLLNGMLHPVPFNVSLTLGALSIPVLHLGYVTIAALAKAFVNKFGGGDIPLPNGPDQGGESEPTV